MVKEGKMTYHIICPISGKRFDFESVPHARRFVMAMANKYNCTKQVSIRDGDRMIGRMKKVGKIFVWKSAYRKKNRNKPIGRVVNLDGTLGEHIEIQTRRNEK